MEDPVLFLAAVSALLFTPGPTNTLLAESGAAIGFRRSLHLLLGELAGYNIAIVALYGLVGNRVSGDDARSALSLVAGIYLAIVAVRVWRAPAKDFKSRSRLRDVFVTTLLNPKGLVFAFVVIPMYSPNVLVYVASFSFIVTTIGCAWVGFGAVVGKAGGGRFRAVVRRAASVVLTIFAAILILSPLLEDGWHWIVDDPSFPKKGRHSVGVAHQ